jgi:hypothetical protein
MPKLSNLAMSANRTVPNRPCVRDRSSTILLCRPITARGAYAGPLVLHVGVFCRPSLNGAVLRGTTSSHPPESSNLTSEGLSGHWQVANIRGTPLSTAEAFPSFKVLLVNGAGNGCGLRFSLISLGI